MLGSWTYDDSRINFDIIPWNNNTDAEFLKCLSQSECGNHEKPREECEKCYFGEPMRFQQNGVIIYDSYCNILHGHLY